MREKASAGDRGRGSLAAPAGVIKQDDDPPPNSSRIPKKGVGLGARRYGSKTPTPLTGTVKRMKHLLYIRHTVHRRKASDVNSDEEEEEEQGKPEDPPRADEKFGPEYINVLGAEHDRPENTVLRCVYNYEDKYRFSRILSNETLCFDSHFESGNLRLAYRVVGSEEKGGVPEYDLILHNDLHSKGHVQWYYFSVSNMGAGQAVRFNILNFSKHDSLYTQGMRPVLFSQHAAMSQGRGWERCGHNIKYHPTNVGYFGRLLGEGKGAWSIGLHTLSFTLTFERPRDVCFLAYCYPYTYSDLQRHLDGHMRQQAHKALAERCLRRTLLCKTLAGNLCDLLVITSPCRRLERLQQRPAVILTGRVHPGESNASYVMKGVIDFLLSSHPKAKALRDRYVFKVVPMLNPDGVVNGNYRTSLAGADLNRRWDHPHPSLHPTIHAAKAMIESTLRSRPVALMVDLHGHSRRQGVFMYACTPDTSSSGYGTDLPPPPAWPRDDHWQPTAPEDIAEQVGLFPSAMSSQCPAFDPSSCRSSMHASKASTMRVVLYTSHHVYNAYTLETSLAGADGRHFTPRDLENVGVDLCLSILSFRRGLRAMQHAHTHSLRQLFHTQLGEGSALDVPPTLSPAPSTVSLAHTYASSVGFLESPTRMDEAESLAAPSSFPPSSPSATHAIQGSSAPHPMADAIPISVAPPSVPASGLLPSLLSPLLPLTPRRIYHLPFAQPPPGGLSEQPSENDVMGGAEVSTLVLERDESSGSDSDPSGDNLEDNELAENMKRAGLARVVKGLITHSPVRTTLPGSEEASKEAKDKQRRKTKKHHRRRHTTGDMPDLSGLAIEPSPIMPQASPNKRYGTQGGRHLRTASQTSGTPARHVAEDEEDTLGSVCTDSGSYTSHQSHHSHHSRQHNKQMVTGLAHRIRLAPRRPGRSSSSSDHNPASHALPEASTAAPISPLSSRSSATAAVISIPSCLPVAPGGPGGSTGEDLPGTSSSASLRRTFSEPAAIMTVGTSQDNIVHQWQHAATSQRQPAAPPAPWVKPKPSTTLRRKTTHMPRTTHPSSHSQSSSSYWEKQHVLLRLAPPADPPAIERPRHAAAAAQAPRPEVEDEPFAEPRIAETRFNEHIAETRHGRSCLPAPAAASRLPPTSTRQARPTHAPTPTPRHAMPAAPFLPLHHPSDRRATRPRIKPPHVAVGLTRKSGKGGSGAVSQRTGGTGGPPGRRAEMGPLVIKPAA